MNINRSLSVELILNFFQLDEEGNPTIEIHHNDRNPSAPYPDAPPAYTDLVKGNQN